MSLGVFALLWTALGAVLVTVCVSSLGAFLARQGFFPGDSLRVLSKLCFNVFLPCYALINIVTGLQLSMLARVWVLPVFSTIYIFMGALVGLLVARVTHVSPSFQYGFITMNAFGNQLGLPVAFLTALAMTPPLSSDGTALARGVAYINVFVFPFQFLFWTFGLYLMGLDTSENKPTSTEPTVHSADSSWDDSNASLPMSALFTSELEESDKFPDMPDKALNYGAAQEDKHLLSPRIKTALKRLFTPPVVALLFGVVIISIPGAPGTITGEHAMFPFVGVCWMLLGQASVPTTLLILGGSLGKSTSIAPSVGVKPLVGMLLGKFVLMPLIGAGLLYVSILAGLVDPNDTVMVLIILMESATPPAQSTAILAQLVGKSANHVVSTLFWTYLAAIPVSVISITCFFLLAESLDPA